MSARTRLLLFAILVGFSCVLFIGIPRMNNGAKKKEEQRPPPAAVEHEPHAMKPAGESAPVVLEAPKKESSASAPTPRPKSIATAATPGAAAKPAASTQVADYAGKYAGFSHDQLQSTLEARRKLVQSDAKAELGGTTPGATRDLYREIHWLEVEVARKH